MNSMEDVVLYIPGNMPIILSSHHDGPTVSLNGEELKKIRDIKNDIGTRNFVWKAREYCFHGWGNILLNCGRVPHTLIFKVKKSRSTEKMLTLYYFKLLEVIGKCIERFGKCYIFDIHRFHKHPEIQDEYDIWFGTDHRNTVNGEFDFKFSSRVCYHFEDFVLDALGEKKSLNIYVPDETPRIGERFMATGKGPNRRIVTKVISEIAQKLHISDRINAVQVEIYKDLLLGDKATDVLARAFAAAILEIE